CASGHRHSPISVRSRVSSHPGQAPEPSDRAPGAPVDEIKTGSRRSHRSSRRTPRRAAVGRRSFNPTLRALEELAQAGAQVSVHVTDLDTDRTVLAGDDHVPLPIAGLGFVPVLVETAAALDAGTMDPLQIVDRSDDELVAGSGLWRNLRAPALPMIDLAVLAAATGDPNAANALLDA